MVSVDLLSRTASNRIMSTQDKSAGRGPLLFVIMFLLIVALIALFILLQGNGRHPGVKPEIRPASAQLVLDVRPEDREQFQSRTQLWKKQLVHQTRMNVAAYNHDQLRY